MHEIPIWICMPFVLLLLLIALVPLTFPKFWERNANKAIVSFAMSLPVLAYILWHAPHSLWPILEEYASFIILLASLFVISGGILVKGDLRATPAMNTGFLLLGAVLSNLVGTTGASMLLIRPVLRTISERKRIYHIPIFFIFIVSNIGGSLTPLGDPPLFLGYLRGVPFTWTFSLLPHWLTTLGILLALFYLWDRYQYSREDPADIRRDVAFREPITVSGKINLIFVAGVVLAVALQIPAPYRELLMVLMSVLSMVFTKRELRAENGFTFHPINEVALLFIGIFITMSPLLELLRVRGAQMGITEPWQFFWITGGLSSFLDNAPSYLTLASLGESVTRATADAAAVVPGIGVRADLLEAISCGAVFMGANSYIGNGPNFMVKSIAEEQGIRLPHFFGYMLYSGLILIPVFFIVMLIFFI